MKEDELQSVLNYLLTMHEVNVYLCIEIDKRGRQSDGESSGLALCIIICKLELWVLLNECESASAL